MADAVGVAHDGDARVVLDVAHQLIAAARNDLHTKSCYHKYIIQQHANAKTRTDPSADITRMVSEMLTMQVAALKLTLKDKHWAVRGCAPGR